MSGLAATLSVLCAAVLGVMVATWLLSLRLRDASIVDVAWGLGFVLVAWIGFWLGPPPSPPRLLLLVLVSVWGGRLALYIARRNAGAGEDYRYAAMRRRRGAAFGWWSLVFVFLLQGLLILIISLPLAVALSSAATSWRPAHLVGSILWGVGFVFEAAGDYQLARFKADPANRGRVMRRGLWRYTRHPNYFGDALVWWGYYAFACAVPGGAWTVISPLLMTFLLLKVSGVALTERSIAERRPAYRDYVATTSAFIPWPPRRRSDGADST